MIASHVEHQSSCTIAVQEVPQELVHQYGIVVPHQEEMGQADCRIVDLIEKPSPEQTPSRLASSARYIFAPEIFAEIRAVSPSPSGEIFLTDAILQLIDKDRMVRAVKLASTEQRYDIGNHRAYFKTFIDYALIDPEWGAEMRAYMESKLK